MQSTIRFQLIPSVTKYKKGDSPLFVLPLEKGDSPLLCSLGWRCWTKELIDFLELFWQNLCKFRG